MDLFRIFQAQWHRGYTRSRNSSIETAVEQEFASASEEEAFVNPHAARMLRAALEFHQGKDALPPGKRPPRLAIANALSYADQPEPGMYLDTADMSLHLGKKVIPFSTDRISMEEELFWSEKIIRERAADKPNRILDLRFYSPDAVEW